MPYVTTPCLFVSCLASSKCINALILSLISRVGDDNIMLGWYLPMNVMIMSAIKNQVDPNHPLSWTFPIVGVFYECLYLVFEGLPDSRMWWFANSSNHMNSHIAFFGSPILRRYNTVNHGGILSK